MNNLLINAFYSAILAFTIVLIIKNYKIVNLKSKYLLGIFIINYIIIIQCYYTTSALGIPLLFIVNLFYLCICNRESIIGNLIVTVLMNLTLLVVDASSGYILVNVFSFRYDALKSNIKALLLLHFLILVQGYLLSKLLGLINKKINVDDLKFKVNVKLSAIVMINMITVTFIVYLNAMINKYMLHNANKMIIAVNIILFLVYFLSNIIVTYYYGKSYKDKIEFEKNKKEYEQLKEYTEMIEDINNNVRKVNHDYLNILSTMYGYIDAEDISGLKKHFIESIIPFSDKVHSKNNTLVKLQHLKLIEIKGLIFCKVTKAISENIEVDVDIPEDVTKVDMAVIDICRIIGILLDNAIEAARECNNARIQIGILSKSNFTTFIIKNTCTINAPAIYDIFKEGFSTKDGHSGLGLNTVKNIIDKKYSNAYLSTTVKNCIFEQEISINHVKSASFEKRNTG